MQSAIFIANVSIHMSLTCWYCIETNAHIVKFFPPGKGMTSSFMRPTTVTKLQGELPQQCH